MFTFIAGYSSYHINIQLLLKLHVCSASNQLLKEIWDHDRRMPSRCVFIRILYFLYNLDFSLRKLAGYSPSILCYECRWSCLFDFYSLCFVFELKCGIVMMILMGIFLSNREFLRSSVCPTVMWCYWVGETNC